MIYSNSLSDSSSIEDWIKEGPIEVEKGTEGVILSSSVTDWEAKGDHAHWLLWCPHKFKDGVRFQWEMKPLREPGLAMVFFGARGHSGDLFGPDQKPRTGYYPQYHSGDIDTLHISYSRHKWPVERAFRTCNLRKSHGFHLVAQGADPMPNAEDADRFYKLAIESKNGHVRFFIEDLLLFEWRDDGESTGPILGEGFFGFRQMAPMKAEYKNFQVTELD